MLRHHLKVEIQIEPCVHEEVAKKKLVYKPRHYNSLLDSQGVVYPLIKSDILF